MRPYPSSTARLHASKQSNPEMHIDSSKRLQLCRRQSSAVFKGLEAISTWPNRKCQIQQSLNRLSSFSTASDTHQHLTAWSSVCHHSRASLWAWRTVSSEQTGTRKLAIFRCCGVVFRCPAVQPPNRNEKDTIGKPGRVPRAALA